jgi:predicted nucleic-acid-binding Zn-ribbon protein
MTATSEVAMQQQDQPTVVCERCGRTADAERAFLPVGWESSLNHAVCPGCKYVEWHPHCTSLVTWEARPEDSLYPNQRVDPKVDWASMPREEWDFGSLTRCEYIDVTIACVEGEGDPPTEWRCPKCGGTEFELVHRDYEPSGIRMFGLTVEVDDDDD